jgi:cytochrome c peroxidase
MSRTIDMRLLLLPVALFSGVTAQGRSLPNLFPFPNASGLLETYNTGDQPIDLTGPFFQSLGTNGRSCGSCHRPAQGWSISAQEVRARFEETDGLDPIFRTNDGSVCDHNVDTSTVAGRRQAYQLLINKGLIRIALKVAPRDPEFTVAQVVNQYGCNDKVILSMYRRPLPSTNLRFLSTVMFDGRESSTETDTQKITFATNPGDLLADLAHQALDATKTHAQASTLTPQQQQAIVDFEMSLSTAQAFDYRAGALNAHGASGGPTALALQTTPAFFVGINDPLGGNPHGTPFTPVIFNLFDAWTNLTSHGGDDQEDDGSRRASIARGQAVFNTKPINITGVAGLNDELNKPSFLGTCGTCHDSPNVGNHSVSAPLNIGVADVNSPLNVAYLPVITLQNKKTHEIKITTDPGRALITGLWKDIGRMKGPILRGLPARAPYFHNGSADSLCDVVEFYAKRFNIGFTPQEKKDLIAFLSAL